MNTLGTVRWPLKGATRPALNQIVTGMHIAPLPMKAFQPCAESVFVEREMNGAAFAYLRERRLNKLSVVTVLT
jgi:hypothetical protein